MQYTLCGGTKITTFVQNRFKNIVNLIIQTLGDDVSPRQYMIRWGNEVFVFFQFFFFKQCQPITYLSVQIHLQTVSTYSQAAIGLLDLTKAVYESTSSSLFCVRPLLAVLARRGISTLWRCPSSISSADHGIAHPSGWGIKISMSFQSHSKLVLT